MVQEKRKKRRLFLYGFVLMILVGCTPQKQGQIESLNIVKDVMVLDQDDQGLLVGTTSGLLRYQPGPDQWSKLPVSLRFIQALYVNEDQGIWAGGPEGLVYYDQEKDKEIQLLDKRVNCLVSHDQMVFVGSWDGLYIYNHKRQLVDHIQAKDGLVSQMVNQVLVLPQGDLWLGSYNQKDGGLSIIEEGASGWQVKDTKQEELINPNITAMLLVDGSIYIGTGLFEAGGLMVYTVQGDQKDQVTKESGLIGEKVRSLYYDQARQDLWIGSEYDGMARWNLGNKTWSYYTRSQGLPHNEVKCFLPYDEVLYIGTKLGLGRLEYKD